MRLHQSDPDDPHFPGLAAPDATTVADLDDALVGCRACPRLVIWREQVASVQRNAFRDWTYWAKPVPGFGPADARLAIVGLASQPTADPPSGWTDPARGATHDARALLPTGQPTQHR